MHDIAPHDWWRYTMSFIRPCKATEQFACIAAEPGGGQGGNCPLTFLSGAPLFMPMHK